MKERTRRLVTTTAIASMAIGLLSGCGGKQETGNSESAGGTTKSELSAADIIKKAAESGQVGNWGLGNEYEVLALLSKYELPTSYLSQDFTMDGFDDNSILLASAMTYNELGLVKNSYDGGYGYGDSIAYIDMNDEGVAMLEDNIFCTKSFAKENPETVAAFLYASLKGWEYAVEHPEEAAEICYEYGSSVSPEHQAYMAEEVAKLVSTDMSGATVNEIGFMDDSAMEQTLNIAKQYVTLDDATANKAFQSLTLDDIRDASYYEAAKASDGKFDIEKKSVSIQLKWLPDAQFMGYYVALDKGYYKEVGFEKVDIVSGGGDIAETTAVNNGTVDFGVTWETNLASADASGMDLVEIAQIFQRSGLVLVYKPENF
ncbi:MAG: ABC transporter substrate-binding protein [Agathobacter sp.]|uniref:ABC transporter substrate-binding protein n=1 Tax=Agathobacter sp. TaxID=2021311 RepID=UPI00258FF526|nr:ABC transporter substrate-binding protein [Agathobacter sp.]MCR5678201.1 ABC transporter substrate-binding protein [Agathobacter sp.]